MAQLQTKIPHSEYKRGAPLSKVPEPAQDRQWGLAIHCDSCTVSVRVRRLLHRGSVWSAEASLYTSRARSAGLQTVVGYLGSPAG